MELRGKEAEKRRLPSPHDQHHQAGASSQAETGDLVRRNHDKEEE